MLTIIQMLPVLVSIHTLSWSAFSFSQSQQSGHMYQRFTACFHFSEEQKNGRRTVATVRPYAAQLRHSKGRLRTESWCALCRLRRRSVLSGYCASSTEEQRYLHICRITAAKRYLHFQVQAAVQEGCTT